MVTDDENASVDAASDAGKESATAPFDGVERRFVILTGDEGDETAAAVPPGTSGIDEKEGNEGEVRTLSEDGHGAPAPTKGMEAEEATEGGAGAESDAEADDGDSPEGEGTEAEADEPEGDPLPELPLVSIVEAVLFASREPLKAAQLARAVGKGVRQSAVKEAMRQLNLHYLETGRAFEIAEISGRFQLMSRPEFSGHIRRIYSKREAEGKDKAARLTPTALDTLSIIAYKQPVTRGEIERIRGVGCGPVLRTLIERGTVRVAGKRADLVGQPLTYGTTDAFLVEFGLGSLDELPLRNEFLNAFPMDMAPVEAGQAEGTIPADTDAGADDGDHA